MTVKSLGVAALMEGGLDLLLRHPLATAIFIAANAMVSYAAVWLQAADINLALAILVGLAVASPVASLFMMALGGNLRDLVEDPVELVVRLVFSLMTSLLVTLGSAIAAIAFIVPGLYVGARWTVAPPLVVLMGRSIVESMNESWRLTELSAWSLVATGVIVAVPTLALSVWSISDPSVFSVEMSAQMVLQNLIGAALSAFGIAVGVFAYHELAPPSDELSKVFA